MNGEDERGGGGNILRNDETLEPGDDLPGELEPEEEPLLGLELPELPPEELPPEGLPKLENPGEEPLLGELISGELMIS